MTITDILKKLKIESGLSTRVLAEQMGVNQFRLQKWLDGAAKPKHEDSAIILEFFQVKSVGEVSEEVLKKVSLRLNSKNKPTPSENGLNESVEEKTSENYKEKYIQVLEKNNDALLQLTTEVTRTLKEINNRMSFEDAKPVPPTGAAHSA